MRNMRKRVALIIMLFTMVSAFILNFGQAVKYIAEKDEIIEWQCYEEELV